MEAVWWHSKLVAQVAASGRMFSDDDRDRAGPNFEALRVLGLRRVGADRGVKGVFDPLSMIVLTAFRKIRMV
jgi:hypothetical protein